jgi:hypothetical protein
MNRLMRNFEHGSHLVEREKEVRWYDEKSKDGFFQAKRWQNLFSFCSP